MPSLTPESRSLLLSHLRADQSERWQRGERVDVEYYLGEHPQLADDPEAVFALIHSELIHRLDGGEQPSLDDYLHRFPSHSDGLRRWWPQWRLIHPELCRENVSSLSTIPDAPPASARVEAWRSPPSLPGLELEGKLGEGGMGVVYRARDIRLAQPRAVKLISKGLLAGDEARDRFNREARAAARLDHEGVVRVYSLGEHEDVLYICMELLEGGNLQARLGQGPLEIRQAADLVRQLALAVQHAHDNWVLHRDLKPANVLLGSAGTAKVADFGLAKLLDVDDGLTRTGIVMGTPSYMAPEQTEGRQEQVTERTDVYALGAILYECLTGRPPFKGDTHSATLEQIKTRPPLGPCRLRPEVPAELEAICLKCLEKQPHQRPATAGELAGHLQDWLDGKPGRIRPVRGLRRLLVGMRRRPGLSVCAGLVLVAAVAAALLGYSLHPDRPLWQARARLAKGQRVELLGATGKPAWSRWRMGEKDAKTLVGPDGTFTVNGWPLTLLELLPDTGGHDHYDLHAEVRHIRSGDHGSIGIYFAGSSQGTPEAPVFSFLPVHFSDVQDAIAQWQLLPDAIQKTVPKPSGNQVLVDHCYALDRPPRRWTINFAGPELFRPAGHSGAPGEWRTIRVEVSPARMRVFWDSKLVGVVTPSRVERINQKTLDDQRRNNPNDPAVEGLTARPDLTGSVGLFLHLSYASFRNVRIEPSAAANASN
jgi:serine/threonine-protein kinase